MKYINEFLRKKKPETFMDYAPGEVPKKTETTVQKPLTLGEVAPKATERVTPRITSNPAKTYNTYTTSNRDLQNIHRNRTNAEQHTGRSLQDISNRSTSIVGDDAHNVPHFHTDSMESYKPRRGGVPSPPALFPYDYGRAQRPSPTNSNDGNHIVITNETYSSNPYGSPVKIVGDNVTEKDYEDFWEAFREESTGEKFNWAANQMQVKPKQQQTNVQTTPQNRRSQNMMQWAMRERENLTEPQSPGRKQYITDEEDRAFLEGFNQDREEESKWNRMLDTVARGMSDVADKVDTIGDGISTFMQRAKQMNIIDAASSTLNDYGKLDDVINSFMKVYDIAQENPSIFSTANGYTSPLTFVSKVLHAGLGELNYSHNDGLAPVGGEDRPYLNVQNTGIIPSLKYGVTTMNENGCGMMAVYNSLKTLGDHEDLKNINRRFENDGQMAFGLLGTNSYEIGDYFKEKGYNVELREGEEITEENIPEADTYILTHTNSPDLLDAVHIVSITRLNNGTYAIYNSDGSSWRGPEIAKTIDDYLNRTEARKKEPDKVFQRYVPLSLQCISKKRG